jgi:iron-sulfur cluster repair protein YtfE (RIC family)
MRFLSEQEYRQSGAEATGLTFNVAFLREIKMDFGFRELLNRVYHRLNHKHGGDVATPREAADLLADLRDELETYFALEECFGYFADAEIENPPVSRKAIELKNDHERLYLELSEVVEMAMRLVYRECGPEISLTTISNTFEQFCKNLATHEQAEMNLVMALCNEDFGVGG